MPSLAQEKSWHLSLMAALAGGDAEPAAKVSKLISWLGLTLDFRVPGRKGRRWRHHRACCGSGRAIG